MTRDDVIHIAGIAAVWGAIALAYWAKP